jgi:hypothetical protein
MGKAETKLESRLLSGKALIILISFMHKSKMEYETC